MYTDRYTYLGIQEGYITGIYHPGYTTRDIPGGGVLWSREALCATLGGSMGLGGSLCNIDEVSP